MMRFAICYMLVMLLIFATGPAARCQSAEVTQLLLDVEKLATLKNILSDMQKGYTILTNGYNTIKSISQGNFSLHQAFLDGLLLINPDIARYKHVADIIADERQLLKSYKTAMGFFKSSGHFSAAEITQLAATYEAVLKDAADVLDELAMLVTASKLRMADDERLGGIDRLYEGIEKQVSFVQAFTNKMNVLVMQRIQSSEDVRMMQRLHGIN